MCCCPCRCGCFRTGKCISAMLIIALGLVTFEYVVDQPSNYVFDPESLQAIARAGGASAGPNATHKEVIQAVMQAAKLAYPSHVSTENGWLFNNAGGAMGTMTVLHSSFSEYLIIFGSALGTEGHTGRFSLVDDYFIIIYGEQWAMSAESQKKEVYKAGDVHHLSRGIAKQYKMPDTGCFALEYARGNIASMMIFGFADLVTSTLDLPTMLKTIEGSGQLMMANAFRGKL